MTADSVRRENQRQKQLQSAIQNTRDFDTASGRIFKPLKSTCATSTRRMEKEVQQTADQFGMKVVSLEKQVGYPVTYKGNRDRKNKDKRTDVATRTVARISRLPKGFGFNARARRARFQTNNLRLNVERRVNNLMGGFSSQIMRTFSQREQT